MIRRGDPTSDDEPRRNPEDRPGGEIFLIRPLSRVTFVRPTDEDLAWLARLADDERSGGRGHAATSSDGRGQDQVAVAKVNGQDR